MEKRRPVRQRARNRPRASTESVVGKRTQEEGIPRRWQKHFKRLERLRDEMRQRRTASEADALEEQPAFSTHMADAGTDSFDRDLALGMLSAEQDAVYEIEQAMDRIRNGSYGKCELTGKPIAEERLEAIPWTRFSADTERELERQGGASKARLGPREQVPRSSQPKPSDGET